MNLMLRIGRLLRELERRRKRLKGKRLKRKGRGRDNRRYLTIVQRSRVDI